MSFPSREGSGSPLSPGAPADELEVEICSRRSWGWSQHQWLGVGQEAGSRGGIGVLCCYSQSFHRPMGALEPISLRVVPAEAKGRASVPPCWRGVNPRKETQL